MTSHSILQGYVKRDWKSVILNITNVQAPQMFRSKFITDRRPTTSDQDLDRMIDDVRTSVSLFNQLQDSIVKNSKALSQFLGHGFKMYSVFKEILAMDKRSEGSLRISEALLIRLEAGIEEAGEEITVFEKNFKDTLSKVGKLLKQINKRIKKRDYLLLDIASYKQELASLDQRPLLNTSEHKKKFELEQKVNDSKKDLSTLEDLLNYEIPRLKILLDSIVCDLTTSIIYFHMRVYFHLYSLTKDVIEVRDIKDLSTPRILERFKRGHEFAKSGIRSLSLLGGQDQEGEIYYAEYAFKAIGEGDLTFERGDAICAIDRSDPGWWTGIRLEDGTRGLFPSNYVSLNKIS
ncbi:DEKNAAC102733 [Brettanomyces naardenensis]|uniref:DEKNAAC102733 n=1 Tax=Brettanomyces naardenensis TaxID=13370 RepID=A0A448YKE4_BRENA|nr:DEKNAAC102733 [Brettanomyces naardenensis]